MDTITHGLSGFLIAEAGVGKKAGGMGYLTLVGASLLPDADYVAFCGGVEGYLRHHRGITHSLVGGIGVCVAAAVMISLVGRLRDWAFEGHERADGAGCTPVPLTYGMIFLLALLAFAVHIALDLTNSYGTMILAPFSDRRFALDWLFIVDFYFAGAAVLAMLLCAKFKTKSIVIARCALGALVAYVGLCAVNHHLAATRWKSKLRENSIEASKTAALPSALSPFNWDCLAVQGAKTHHASLGMFGKGWGELRTCEEPSGVPEFATAQSLESVKLFNA
jgi:inner membrane protein